jgi:hypothetical protein
MNWEVKLKSSPEPVIVIVPSKPKEEEKNHRQLIVKVNRKDGTLERVFGFDRICIISIKEIL